MTFIYLLYYSVNFTAVSLLKIPKNAISNYRPLLVYLLHFIHQPRAFVKGREGVKGGGAMIVTEKTSKEEEKRNINHIQTPGRRNTASKQSQLQFVRTVKRLVAFCL